MPTPVYEVHNPGFYQELPGGQVFYQEHLGYVSANDQTEALEQAQEEFNPNVEVIISYYHPDYEE